MTLVCFCLFQLCQISIRWRCKRAIPRDLCNVWTFLRRKWVLTFWIAALFHWCPLRISTPSQSWAGQGKMVAGKANPDYQEPPPSFFLVCWWKKDQLLFRMHSGGLDCSSLASLEIWWCNVAAQWEQDPGRMYILTYTIIRPIPRVGKQNYLYYTVDIDFNYYRLYLKL